MKLHSRIDQSTGSWGGGDLTWPLKKAVYTCAPSRGIALHVYFPRKPVLISPGIFEEYQPLHPYMYIKSTSKDQKRSSWGGSMQDFWNGGGGGGSNLGLHAKQGGPALGPVIKSLHRGLKETPAIRTQIFSYNGTVYSGPLITYLVINCNHEVEILHYFSPAGYTYRHLRTKWTTRKAEISRRSWRCPAELTWRSTRAYMTNWACCSDPE